MQRAQTLFLVKFFGILVAAYLLVAWKPVNDNVIVPFTTAIATASGALLNGIGQNVDKRDPFVDHRLCRDRLGSCGTNRRNRNAIWCRYCSNGDFFPRKRSDARYSL